MGIFEGTGTMWARLKHNLQANYDVLHQKNNTPPRGKLLKEVL